jgi:hypothetical protein
MSYYRDYQPMAEGKSEILSQEPRYSHHRSIAARRGEIKISVEAKEAKEVKEVKGQEEVKGLKTYDNRGYWPPVPEGKDKQVIDSITRVAFRTEDVEYVQRLLQISEFTKILDTLGVKYQGDGIYDKLMFHPGRKRLVLEYNFDKHDPYDHRCGLCGVRESHKLIVEITRKTRRIIATCFGDFRKTEVMTTLTQATQWTAMGGWELSLDVKQQEKADRLVKALQMGRKDKNLWVWDEYSVYDPYTFSDFVYELAAFPHASEEDVILFAATRINRVLAIIPPETYNVKKNLDSELFHGGKGYPRMAARYTFLTEKGKKRVVVLNEKKIIEGLMAVGLIRIYRGKDVFADKKPPREYLNVWTGFQVERNIVEMGDSNRPSIVPLMDFLENWICSCDKGLFAALMKWFVELLARPWNKVPWAVWLYTPEKRMGKGLLCDFLFNYVFGSQTMKKFNGMAEILHTHNAWCEGKKLVVVEEASARTEDWKTGWDLLKSWTADKTISVHKKFVDQYDSKSLFSIMIISNHYSSLHLEPEDRRYLCLKPTDSLGKKSRCSYFKELQACILTMEMGREFYNLCCRTDEFDHIDPYHSDPPLNLLKEQILEDNLMPEHLFISEVGTMRWRTRIQDCLFDLYAVTPLFETEKRRRFFDEVEAKDEKVQVITEAPDYDPEDLIADDAIVLDPQVDGKNEVKIENKTENKTETKSETIDDRTVPSMFLKSGDKAFLDMWRAKLKKYSKENFDKVYNKLQSESKTFTGLIERIGLTFQIEDVEEKQMAEEMEMICINGPTVTTDKLYKLYLKWFIQRVSEGKGKSPVNKIALGKKMAQCMKRSKRETHVEGRSRAWNLDTVYGMYIPFKEYDTLSLWTPDTKRRTQTHTHAADKYDIG